MGSDVDDLDGVDCFDDEDPAELGTPELDFLHETMSRRGALDIQADRYGLGAVTALMLRGLEQTSQLGGAGLGVAVIPDELGRFLEADHAAWARCACGLWHGGAGECCGVWRRDDVAELTEVCVLAPHDGPHGYERAALAVTW